MKKVLLALVIMVSFLSCQKDISMEPGNPVIGSAKLPASPLTGSVAGVVLNENNTPVANAQVVIGNNTYVTNANGFFNSPAISLDKYISTVKVTMPGYFTAYRSFSANATKNYVSIKLIPKTLAGTFTSSASGAVNLPNGSSITFQANGVNVKSTGAAYSGTVNVYASYIDPTSADFGAVVPGSMMAEDATSFFVLRSTGMMAVEMESPSGVPLQLAANKPATMKLNIPASLLSKAPSEIDTWSLDERGVWIKEGTAVRSGNAYDFPVSHFSFWNCDVPTTAVYLTINVKDNNGINQINKYITLTSSTTFGTTGGHTDSLGNVSGMVPQNETLELKAYNGYYYNCGAPYYTQNIGPFGSNSSLNIVTPQVTTNTWILTGTATNCSGAPVTSGTVITYVNGMQIYNSFSNGSFADTFNTCAPITSVEIIVIDHANQQQSSSITLTASGQTINAGAVSACGTTTTQFITYIVDGTTFNISSNNATSSLFAHAGGPGGTPTETFMYGFDQSANQMISFGVSGAAVGTFPVGNDSLTVNNIPNPIAQSSASTTFTAYGPVGQFIEGTFNIPFEATGAVHTLTGSFRIRRN